MIELNLLTIFYNFDKSKYSNFILKQLEKISSENNYRLILYPENYNFSKYSTVKKLLTQLSEDNISTIKKYILITNSNDILLELSNFMKLSFLNSDNTLLYLHTNKIDKKIILNANKINVYELDNKQNGLKKIESGYFGINSNKLKSIISISNKRYNEINDIYLSYSSFNKEYYKILKS